jgi:murein DD-endopeptidase MepM/ murein hydrolase activator NlpD
MKNLFYFSEKKLKYIEVKNFYPKFVSLVVIFSLVFGFVMFGTYTVISGVLSEKQDIELLAHNNEKLVKKFKQMSKKISDLNKEIETLQKTDSDLRLSVNLKPLDEKDRALGVGGSVFKEYIPTNVSSVSEIIKGIDNSLESLSSKVTVQKENYSEIKSSLEKNKKLFESLPAILPCDGPIGDKFGMRMHPILKRRRMHAGLDIVVNTGTKIYAPGNAKVISTGYRNGYGYVVELDHGFGYTSLYAHLSKILVKKGNSVKRGEVIGLSGKTGSMATGPHLHYEIRHNGIPLNPRNFLFNDIKLFDFIATTSKQENNK